MQPLMIEKSQKLQDNTNLITVRVETFSEGTYVHYETCMSSGTYFNPQGNGIYEQVGTITIEKDKVSPASPLWSLIQTECRRRGLIPHWYAPAFEGSYDFIVLVFRNYDHKIFVMEHWLQLQESRGEAK